MGTGQTMITLLAMVLLSFLILRINNSFLQTNTTLYDTKFEVLGYSLAQSIIQEIEKLHFDQNTVSAVLSDSTLLTSTLGPDSGETTADTFNDVDDYNNYTRNDTIPPHFGVVFNSKCKVEYVLPTSPDVPTASQTWHKRITVFVTSPYMIQNALTNQYYTKVVSTTPVKQDTIKLSQVFSYWSFK
jgi:hypothetical protein